MGKSLTLYEYKDKLIRDNKGKEEILLIKEVIVVEGKDDVAAVKKAVDAEMIAVGGFGINARVIARIKEAQKRKGVIVLTDPDFAGEKIRKIIEEGVNFQQLCRVFFKYEEAYRYYFPLKTGEKLFLGAEEDDFIIDGYSVRRFRDIKKSIRWYTAVFIRQTEQNIRI